MSTYHHHSSSIITRLFSFKQEVLRTSMAFWFFSENLSSSLSHLNSSLSSWGQLAAMAAIRCSNCIFREILSAVPIARTLRFYGKYFYEIAMTVGKTKLHLGLVELGDEEHVTDLAHPSQDQPLQLEVMHVYELPDDGLRQVVRPVQVQRSDLGAAAALHPPVMTESEGWRQSD